MIPSARGNRLAVAALAVLALGAGVAGGSENSSQFTFGTTLLEASPPCPVRELPSFEAITPVPSSFDPFAEDFLPMFCLIQVQRKGQGVKNAKATYETMLIVQDNQTGESESFPIGSGRFKTGTSGFDSFDFDLPSELFADGFESGDVSAWSYTRTDFTNKKKADQVRTDCGRSTSSSSEQARRGKDARGPSR